MPDLSVRKSLNKKIGTLERRLSFLNQRIANYSGKSPSHDLAEASAISFAIDLMLTHRDEATALLRTSKDRCAE